MSVSQAGGFLSLKEAAEYLGVSETFLYRRVAQNEIRHFRFGRAIRFRREDLDAWAAQHASGAAAHGSEA